MWTDAKQSRIMFAKNRLRVEKEGRLQPMGTGGAWRRRRDMLLTEHGWRQAADQGSLCDSTPGSSTRPTNQVAHRRISRSSNHPSSERANLCTASIGRQVSVRWSPESCCRSPRVCSPTSGSTVVIHVWSCEPPRCINLIKAKTELRTARRHSCPR